MLFLCPGPSPCLRDEKKVIAKDAAAMRIAALAGRSRCAKGSPIAVVVSGLGFDFDLCPVDRIGVVVGVCRSVHCLAGQAAAALQPGVWRVEFAR